MSSASPTPVRRRGDSDLAAVVAPRLTPRDRAICQVLFDHRVLTTDQVVDLCFANVTTARHRLAVLHQLRVLDRFRPFRPTGSAPWHWVLDSLGVEVVAADRGIEVPRPTAHHARALALADSQRLAHLLGVNGIFCSLARWARSRGDAELAEWWPERRCVSEWGQVVRPDAFGVVSRGEAVVEFFVEYDAGTETLARLAAKLDGYADLMRATGWSPWVAFWFPASGREAEARKVLNNPTVAVVTAAAELGTGAGGAVWLRLGSEGPRRHLVELPSTAGKGGRQ